MDVTGIGSEGVDWAQLSQDTDKWTCSVNLVTTIRILKQICRTQEGLCFAESVNDDTFADLTQYVRGRRVDKR